MNPLTDCQAPTACLDSLDRVTPDHIAETRNAIFFRPCFVVPAGDVTSKNARSAADGSAGVAARFWPKKASIAVNHHSADGMLPLLLVCCVCLCRRVWSAVLLCCRVVCCVKGKRRVSTEMSRRYLPRVQGMFCLDAKRLDRQP